jgi:hypothetical protein
VYNLLFCFSCEYCTKIYYSKIDECLNDFSQITINGGFAVLWVLIKNYYYTLLILIDQTTTTAENAVLTLFWNCIHVINLHYCISCLWSIFVLLSYLKRKRKEIGIYYFNSKESERKIRFPEECVIKMWVVAGMQYSPVH